MYWHASFWWYYQFHTHSAGISMIIVLIQFLFCTLKNTCFFQKKCHCASSRPSFSASIFCLSVCRYQRKGKKKGPENPTCETVRVEMHVCETRCMKGCMILGVWDEVCEIRWPRAPQWTEVSWVRSIEWFKWREMSCVRWVDRDELGATSWRIWL